MNTPLKVYIDTNILNDVAPKDKPWETTRWGKYLLELSENGTIEVWASPGNCLEIALNSNYNHRNNMALALNTLIRGQRMMPAYETAVIENFLVNVEKVWPGEVAYGPIQKLKKQSQQIYIALLGQLAALKDYDCRAGFPGIIRPKIITQIIHADLFEDPKAKLAMRLNQLRDKQFDQENIFASYDQMSTEDLQKLEQTLREKTYPVDKSAVTFLKNNKQEFIEGYSNEELNFAVNQVFEYFDDALFSIQFLNISKKWNPTNDRSVKPLHPDLVSRLGNNPERGDIAALLNALQDRFYSKLGTPKMYYTIIVNELEKALNMGKIPTGGLILDGHHAIAAMNVNYFLCRDSKLLSAVKTIYKGVTAIDGVTREAMDSMSEFERKIKSALNKK
ncbi:MAG: hypothetical protein JWM28_967 [Chitinophagaceae bacterium]|nr:hypothetical protein [Chitinophagaceae bacterium]